jgi:hypothetical protein
MALIDLSMCMCVRQQDFDERVLPSIVNEVTKAVVAKYNAAELLTKREQVSKAVSSKLYSTD